MSKPLDQMSDSEFFCECSQLLSGMCESLRSSHESLAIALAQRPDEKVAGAMLEFSMRYSLEGVGNILNHLDLFDPSLHSSPVFDELHRRFPRQS